MLKMIGGTIFVCAWWIVIGFAFLLFAGCDALVADNPACEYDCASSSSYTGGR